MEQIQCRIILHGSKEYWDTVQLRYKILRIPLNLDYRYSELIAENNDIHVAAYSGKKLVGCLILTPLNDGKMKMRQVAVDDAVQKRGVGREMVHFSESFCLENGYKEIVMNARDTAVPFYLNLSYEVYDEPFIEVSIPHRKMRKNLQLQ